MSQPFIKPENKETLHLESEHVAKIRHKLLPERILLIFKNKEWLCSYATKVFIKWPMIHFWSNNNTSNILL